jgi:hypothetical protein
MGPAAAALWKQLIAQLRGCIHAAYHGSLERSRKVPMSKRTRHGDNSKRMQPVQQQRAEAARLANSAGKAGKRSEQPAPQERSPEKR